MTTTGTTSFNLDMNDLIEESFERCGLEVRSGYDFRTARRSVRVARITARACIIIGDEHAFTNTPVISVATTADRGATLFNLRPMRGRPDGLQKVRGDRLPAARAGRCQAL